MLGRVSVLLLLVTGAAATAHAQSAYRLRDIRPGPGSSSPQELVSAGNVAVFVADDDEHGREIWRSDGTREGTSLLLDVVPGPDYGYSRLTQVGSHVFALVTHWSPPAGPAVELWKTDGTPGGTLLVKQWPGSTSAERLVASDSVGYFAVATASTGQELWKTDGTPEGTVLVKDIAPGSASSMPTGLVAFPGGIVFGAYTPSLGWEIWKSDGTTDGTTLVRDISPGSAGSNPTSPKATWDGQVFFSATRPSDGRELWVTDGTPAGTRPLADLNPGGGSSNPDDICVANDLVYFTASDPILGEQLYRTDGTSAGTLLLTPGMGPVLAAGPLAYFSGGTGAYGLEPHVTDGTIQGTRLLKDIEPGSLASYPEFFGDVGGRMYFRASTLASGTPALWRSDGTEGGTEPVPGWTATTWTNDGVVIGGRLFFAAHDETNGEELWTVEAGAPEANAGPDQRVADGPSAHLDASASSDPEGDPLSFEWRDANDIVLASTAAFDVTLPVGAHELTVAVSDGTHTSFDTVVVRVGALLRLTVDGLTWHVGYSPVDVQPGGTCAVGDFAPVVCEFLYATGTTVTLTPTPPPGFELVRWTGACSGNAPCTLTMTDLVEVEAYFSDPLRLSVFVSGSNGGLGAIHIDPPGAVCEITTPNVGASCPQEDVVPGSVFQLTATPAPGSVFVGWGNDACPGTGPCTVTVWAHTSISAWFDVPRILSIAAASEESGLGSVIADPPGTTCTVATPGSTQSCSESYATTEIVTLTAIAAPGSTFIGWTGACSGTGPCSVSMWTHQSVGATFRGPVNLTLTLAGTSGGSGSVVTDPPGTACALAAPAGSSQCVYSYATASTVTLTATPDAGSQFTGWNGACTGTAPCTVAMSSSKNVGAVFLGPRTLEITAYGVDNGIGSVVTTPPGSTCAMPTPNASTECLSNHENGQVVTLTAVAGSGSVFERWEDACTGSGPCTVAMSANRQVKARFAGPRRLTLWVQGNPGGVGSVVSDPPGSTCAVTVPNGTNICDEYYPYGAVVTLTPQPSPLGFVFTGWSGPGTNCPGTGPCTVTMSANRTITADFRAVRTLSITVVSEDGGEGKASPYGVVPDCVVTPSTSPMVCQHTYPSGTVVMMTASAAPGSYFAGWTGACSGTGQCSPQLIHDASVTAVFRRSNQLPTIALTSPAGGSVLAAGVPTTVVASASDPDGSVARVDFYITNGAWLGYDSAPPYTAAWVPSAPGAYTLVAQVTDDDGATVLSSTVPVTVVANQPPTLSITSPLPGAVFVAPATVTLSAHASDPDGTVTRVEFFEGATSRGFDTTSPYSVTWSGVTAGNHALTTVATDNNGATTTVPLTVAVGARVGASADTFVRDGTHASTNYGGASTLDVRKVTTVGHNRRAFLKFAVDSVPTVTNARLRLFGRLTGTQSFPVQALVFAVADTSWAESAMTWNNQPPTAPTPLAGVVLNPNPSNEQWYEWDVSAHVQVAKAAGQTAVTLAIEEDVYAQGAAFRARTAAVGMRPQLVLTP